MSGVIQYALFDFDDRVVIQPAVDMRVDLVVGRRFLYELREKFVGIDLEDQYLFSSAIIAFEDLLKLAWITAVDKALGRETLRLIGRSGFEKLPNFGQHDVIDEHSKVYS
jgi:hypothetical protein